MTRINLTGGSYQARSPTAAAQRQLNLYSEPQPGDSGEPAPVANYHTPGLTLLGSIAPGPIRGIHTIAGGRFAQQTFIVSGNLLFNVSIATNPIGFTAFLVGTITSALTTPVSMADNGISLVVVDGFPGAGWTVTLGSNAFAAISDPNFFGANTVAYLDTYFLFNKLDPTGVATPVFQWTASNATTFPPLSFGSKTGYIDACNAVVAAKREVWLIGDFTSEIWFDTGQVDSAFQRVEGAFVDHGTQATYSIASIDNSVFWLSQDRQGGGVILQGAGYEAQRVSTFALESAMATYSRLSNAVGWTYQLGGHVCYVITFPDADKTWVYDLSTKQWHEWAWTDPATGLQHAHRGRCSFVLTSTGSGGVTSLQPKTFTLVGDRINGNIYTLDQSNQTDNGDPIFRQRAFMHLEGDDGQRLFFRQFLANISVGTAPSGTPQLTLDWSDDRGATWGNPITSSLGAFGDGLTSVQFQRLGMARSRVFRLSWNANADIALLGAWVDVDRAIS